MENKNNVYEEIKSYLESLNEDSLLYIYNNYLENEDKYDDSIYSMEDFDEILDGVSPWEIARMCFYGDFKPADRFFKYNGYGNLVSMDYVSSEIDIDDIVRYIIDNNDSLYDEAIEEILGDYGNEEDEE